MRRHHILHFIDDLNMGGAEQVLAKLTRAMESTKYKPIVATLVDGPLRNELGNIETIVIEKRRPFDIKLLWDLLRFVKKRRISLIHTHLLISDIYGFLAAKLSGIPSVITLHGKSLFEKKHGDNIFPFVARYSNKIITVSNNLKDEVKKKVGIPCDNFTTIYNGIDLIEFKTGPSEDILRKELNISPSSFVVGSVGRLSAVKDYNCLLESVPLILKENPETKFVIIGDGPLKNELKAKSVSLDISKSVFFLGQRHDISYLLPSFDIFVLSSKTEGVSIAILEAMATGRPVVATNVGGNPEIIKDGENGLLVHPANPAKLAEGIINLLNDKSRRLSIGKAGRKTVEKKFSLQAMVREYESIYDTLLS